MKYHIRGDPADIQCESETSAALGELVDDYGAGNSIAPGSAVFLRKMYADETGGTEPIIQIEVKTILVRPFIARFNFLFRELAYHITDHGLFFRKLDEHYVASSVFSHVAGKLMNHICTAFLWRIGRSKHCEIFVQNVALSVKKLFVLPPPA